MRVSRLSAGAGATVEDAFGPLCLRVGVYGARLVGRRADCGRAGSMQLRAGPVAAIALPARAGPGAHYDHEHWVGHPIMDRSPLAARGVVVWREKIAAQSAGRVFRRERARSVAHGAGGRVGLVFW